MASFYDELEEIAGYDEEPPYEEDKKDTEVWGLEAHCENNSSSATQTWRCIAFEFGFLPDEWYVFYVLINDFSLALPDYKI